MSEWRTVTLKDLCERITVGHVGTMADKYVDSGIPFLRSLNIKPFFLEFDDLKFIDEQFHRHLKKSSLRPNDIVVVRTGYPGVACVIPSSLTVANCSDLVIITPSKDLNPYFLAAVFNSVFGQNLVSGNLVGAAQQHFNITVAKELKLRIPTKAIQDKIAAILTSYNDLIDTNNKRIAFLEKAAEEIYREWFVRMRFPGWQQVKFEKGIPEGWVKLPIAQIGGEIRGSVKIKNVDPNMRYLGLEHLPRKSFAITSFDTIDSVQSDKLLFKEGDILFGKIRPYLHKVALAHFSGACSSDTIIIRPREKEFEGYLLFTVFSETFIELATVSSKGTKMPRADWGFLKQLEILLPSKPILSQYQQYFDMQFGAICKLLKQNELLKQSRDLLLSRLISGKLPVDNLDIHFPPSMMDNRVTDAA